MPTGPTQDAGWEIGVSRTLPHPPSAVWEFVASPEGVVLWLGAGAELTPEKGAAYRTDEGMTGEVRGYRPNDRIRLTHGATTVQVTVSGAASGAGEKAVLRFHQEQLASAGEREAAREHWRAVLDTVAAALGGA
ncbi:SRPBCC family protein [Streptomyces sp. A5-4]|uniref:SRPBCC family protein n=1 Tax=Streptomyces sp. A5-4 TaxID=3384771 RepID=UPI003DA82C67